MEVHNQLCRALNVRLRRVEKIRVSLDAVANFLSGLPDVKLNRLLFRTILPAYQRLQCGSYLDYICIHQYKTSRALRTIFS